MSELPRTDDLPRSDDGFDPARVEEAFASFAERVHELETIAGELRAELKALRSEREAERRPPRVSEADDEDEEDWPADNAFSSSARASSADWVAAVPPPLLRPFAVPRVALEGVFLLVVALLAGLADLDAVWIVLVMTAAWVLVALSEWTAAAKRARWRLDEIALSAAPDGDQAADSTGPWSMPVVEATAVAPADDSESRTVIATLPEPAGDGPEPEQEPEPAAGEEQPVEPTASGEGEPPQEATRRRRFVPWRRREPDAASDPWEV